MASNMATYIDALDKVRAGMRDLDGIVEGSDDQAVAVLALARDMQTLASAARMLRSDYRHGRNPYIDRA